MSFYESKLFLVERISGGSYDTYDSFVVICDTEDEARKTHPSNGKLKYHEPLGYWDDEIGGSNKYNKNGWIYGNEIYTNLQITYLGDISATKKGLILASFNAG